MKNIAFVKNKSRIVAAAVSLAVLCSTCIAPLSADAVKTSAVNLKAGSVTIKVNGTALSASGKTAPVKKGSGILAPAKKLASALGAKYSRKGKKATLKKGKAKLVFTLGKSKAKLNGKTVKLKTTTVKKGGMPMVEAATTALKLGFKTASYVSDKNTLYIASSKLTGKLVINEVCSYNKTCFVDENNKHSDWVEIYNGTYEAIDLNGYYMTDKAEKPTKAKITGGTTVIRSGGYAIMVLSGNSVVISTKYPHLNFRLSKEGGETVYLMAKDGSTIIDKVQVPALDADKTYGRSPNGSGSFKLINSPTPGKAN